MNENGVIIIPDAQPTEEKIVAGRFSNYVSKRVWKNPYRQITIDFNELGQPLTYDEKRID